MTSSSSGRLRSVESVSTTSSRVRGLGAGSTVASTAWAAAFSRWAAAIRGGDDFGGDARFQPVEVLGELAFALHERSPSPDDGGVLAMALGVGLHDLPSGGRHALGGEHLAQP